METIKMYKVSFVKDGVNQVHIVETAESPVYIGHWYRDVHGATYVWDVDMFSGVLKPGQPLVRI